jgi:tyrosine-protein kinase Etk/Wzc
MTKTNQRARQEEKEATSLNNIIRRILPYWPLLVLAAILSFVTAKIYLRYATKVYKVQARVIVNDEDQEKSSSGLLNIQLDGAGYFNETEKEVEILQSRTLLSVVVKKLHLQASFTKEGSVKQSSVYGENSPFRLLIFEGDSIRQTFEGKVTLATSNRINYLDKTYPVDTVIESEFGKIKWEVLDPKDAAKEVNLRLVPMRAATLELKSKLKVLPINNQSSIVDLILLDEDPGRAKVILSSLLEIYSANHVGFKRRIAENTLKFIDERLGLISGELNDVEEDLEKFKTKEGVVDLSTEGQLFLNEVSRYDQEIGEINVRLQVLDNLEKYVNRRNNEEVPIPATLGLEDPLLQSLLQQLFQAEFDLDRIKKLSGLKNPQIEVLNNEIAKLKPSISQSIKNLKSSIEQKKRTISNATVRRENSLKKIPKKERLLLDISRQQSIKNSIYTFLLQKREEAAISSASIVPNNRVIDTPESMGVERPKNKLVYIYAWALFFLILVAYIYFKEFSNKNFIYKQELIDDVGLPIVGELIYSANNEKGLVVKPGIRNIINEQFRELRTNISFLKRGSKSQSILITSSTSGEGKSFVSVNLATSLANAGRKVVLLEFDLRKPKIHQYLGIEKGNGLSNFLVGNIELSDILKQVNSTKDLTFISAGHLPPNPAELLMNTGNMNQLFDYLRNEFEYIIIDAPPIGLVTDAKIIAPYSDTCLYVVRYGYTNRHFAELIRDTSSSNILPSVNIVFNAISRQKNLGYGYGYGYSYGYGYTDEIEQNDKSIIGRLKNIFRK